MNVGKPARARFRTLLTLATLVTLLGLALPEPGCRLGDAFRQEGHGEGMNFLVNAPFDQISDLDTLAYV